MVGQGCSIYFTLIFNLLHANKLKSPIKKVMPNLFRHPIIQVTLGQVADMLAACPRVTDRAVT
jgi:hypothetical protein